MIRLASLIALFLDLNGFWAPLPGTHVNRKLHIYRLKCHRRIYRNGCDSRDILPTIFFSLLPSVSLRRKIRPSPDFAPGWQEKNGRRCRTSLFIFEFFSGIISLFLSFCFRIAKIWACSIKDKVGTLAFASFVNLQNKISTLGQSLNRIS